MSLRLSRRLRLTALLAGLGLCVSAHAAIVERVVAVVDQSPILLTDLQERAKPFLGQVYGGVPEGPQRSAAISQVYQTVLDRMIEEKLEDAAATRAGITVTAQEIDEALERLAAQNQITLAELIEEARQNGLTIHQYREELERQLLQNKLAQLRLTGRIRIDESDVKNAYRDLVFRERSQQAQRTLRIVMPLGSTLDEQAEQTALAEDVVRRAREGEDFRALVREFGTLPGSGAPPPTPPESEPKPIARASMSLDAGEISRPVRVDNTLVILKIVDRPPSSLPPYVEAREAIYQRVYMEKMAKARKHWLDGLRRRTYVEIRK